jgi:hypothetical protein
MRKTTFVGSLFIVSVLLSGCIVVSSSKKQLPPQETKSPCVQTPQVSATMAEIDAAGKLTSQSARANIYMAIAQRPGLAPQERIHLTNAITMHLTSQSDREEVLLTLVNNHPPAVQPVPRQIPSQKPQNDTASEEPATEK